MIMMGKSIRQIWVNTVFVDYLEEENEVEPHNDLNISSFLVKKTDDPNRHSYPTEEDIQSEPIYCKIQSKVSSFFL